MTQKLDDLINEIIVGKTFSVEAVEGIQQLREDHAEVTQMLEDANYMIKASHDRIERLEKDNSGLRSDLKKEVAIRELNQDLVANAVDLKIQTAASNATANAFREAMQIVFKPTLVREAIMASSTKVSPTGAYITDTHNTTTTKESE